jgi:hypothetical protein
VAEEMIIAKQPLSEKITEYAIFVCGWGYYYNYIAKPRTRDEVEEFIQLETLELYRTLVNRKELSAKVLIACEKG